MPAAGLTTGLHVTVRVGETVPTWSSRNTVAETRVAADQLLGDARKVSELASDQPQSIALNLDDAGVSVDLPRPAHQEDQVYGVPYRPVEFRDDDLPTALERSAAWLRRTQDWLGEPVDVIAIHLDYDDSGDSPYYDVKLLCNEEDLAGAPIALRSVKTTD